MANWSRTKTAWEVLTTSATLVFHIVNTVTGDIIGHLCLAPGYEPLFRCTNWPRTRGLWWGSGLSNYAHRGRFPSNELHLARMLCILHTFTFFQEKHADSLGSKLNLKNLPTDKKHLRPKTERNTSSRVSFAIQYFPNLLLESFLPAP